MSYCPRSSGAWFPRQSVILACEKTLATLDRSRADRKAEIVARELELNSRRLRLFRRNPNDVSKIAERAASYAVAQVYGAEERAMIRLLRLAQATEKDEIFVSADDFERLRANWPERQPVDTSAV